MAERLKEKRVVVTDAPGRCEALIAEVGEIDVLMVNLASGANAFSVLQTEDETLERMFGRMVRPLHRLTRAVLPQMIARRRGKIVVVGSASAIRGQADRAAYSAARAAQHGTCARSASRSPRTG